jgi:hypothetical protein
MTLEEIAKKGARLPLAVIGGDKVLTRQIQDCLGGIGLLDPPPDGYFGPVSLWAIGQFLRKIGSTTPGVIDAAAARAMLSKEYGEIFPLNRTNSLASRIVQAMQSQGQWICRYPECINIVYVEGMDLDGTPNSDTPNEFNDLRLALRVNRAGNPDIMDAWEATTEPGKYYTLIEKLDPRGAARIAFGQYKSWSVGIHMASRPSAHEALVQTAPIRVHRDLNADFERTGDAVFEGLFGINQHYGFDMPKSDIGRASAGCLVGRKKSEHRVFMSLCKKDPRYVANHSYRFMTTVLAAQHIASL